VRGGASLSRALLAAILALGAVAPAATGPATAAAIAAATQLDACAQRLDAARDVGVARIMARCPELARAWQRDGAAFGLPRNWRDVGGEVSADSLRELARLLRATAALPPRETNTATPLRVATLDAVLADWPPFEDAGLIARVLRWIRARVGADPTLVEPKAGGDSRDQSRFGAWMARVLPWVALLATLALLVWVLQRERRAAHAARASHGSAPGSSPDVAATSHAAAAPVSPGDWLAVLAARLAARGLLRHPAGATSREILAAAPSDARLATQWTLLATVADEARYAPRPPDPGRRSAALAAGLALAEALR
jgi:hypothetical protein